jgi:FMN phosphatase YigB (HAD superfamily)
VVWDLGGVVLRWDPAELMAETLSRFPDRAAVAGLVPPGARLHDAGSLGPLVSAVFQDFTPDSDWSAFDRGDLDVDELRSRICRRTGLGTAVVASVLDGVPSHLSFLAGTERLVDRVVAAGHRVVFLSNMPPDYADWLESEPRFTGRFDRGVFSCRVHAVKPEPEIYRIAEDELDLGVGPVLMIDDRPANLIPAVDRGWTGLRFLGADRCAADLERLGWL